jgi:hypothetical protein
MKKFLTWFFLILTAVTDTPLQGQVVISNATLSIPTQSFFLGPWSGGVAYGITALGANLSVEGLPAAASGYLTGSNWLCYQAQGIRFTSSTHGISVIDECLGNTNGFVLYCDGVAIATNYPNRPANQWGTDILATAQSGIHNYKILAGANNISRGTGGTTSQVGQTVYTFYNPVWGINVDAGSITASNYTPLEVDEWYGDSIVAGIGTFDYQANFCFLTSSHNNHSVLLKGFPGQRVAYTVANTTNYINPNLSRLVNNIERNDVGVTTIGAIGSPGTFTGDYYQMIVAERGLIGANKMIYNKACLRDSALGGFATYDNAISNLTAAYITNTGDTNVLYIPPCPTLVASNFISDDTHPNGSGNALDALFNTAYFLIGLR